MIFGAVGMSGGFSEHWESPADIPLGSPRVRRAENLDFKAVREFGELRI